MPYLEFDDDCTFSRSLSRESCDLNALLGSGRRLARRPVCKLHVKRAVTMTCCDAVFAATLSDKTWCQGTQALREQLFPRVAKESVGLMASTSSGVLELEKCKEVRST